MRTNHENIATIDPGDTAAARADRVDRDLRRAVGVAANELLIGHRNGKTFDQAHVSGRPAHVAGDHVVDAGQSAEMNRRRDTAGRTGQNRRDRQFRRARGGRNTAVRRRDVERTLIALGLQRSLQIIEVTRHQRANESVECGRVEALVFPELRQHVRRQRDVPARKRLLERISGFLLVLGIGVAVQEADREAALLAFPAQPVDRGCEAFAIQFLADTSIIEHTLFDLERARARDDRALLQ